MAKLDLQRRFPETKDPIKSDLSTIWRLKHVETTFRTCDFESKLGSEPSETERSVSKHADFDHQKIVVFTEVGIEPDK